MRRGFLVFSIVVSVTAMALWWFYPGAESPRQVSDMPASRHGGSSQTEMQAEVASPETVATGQSATTAPANQSIRATNPSAPLPEPMQRQLDAITRRDDKGLKEEHLPSGAVRLELQGRFQHAPVAEIDEDGNITLSEQ